MDEIWKPVPVPGYEHKYSVSNLGRVKPNVVSRYSKNRAEVLKPSHSRRYMHITMVTGGKSKSAFIHRMVAIAFVGPPPFDGAIVCHKDDCKTNNRADNLEWGTAKSNADTREAIGKTSRGIGNGRAILTEADVIAIRARYAAGGVSQQTLADEYGVEQSAVSRAILRKAWRHL